MKRDPEIPPPGASENSLPLRARAGSPLRSESSRSLRSREISQEVR